MTSSDSPSPSPDLRAASSSGQSKDSQSFRDASTFPPDPSSLATTLSTSNHTQKQVYTNGVDSFSSSQKPYHLPVTTSNLAVQAKSKTRPLFYPSASTSLSTSSSSGGTTTLTYHLITRHLALLAVIPTAVYEERKGLVEYNVVFFREGIQEICDVEDEVRSGG